MYTMTMNWNLLASIFTFLLSTAFAVCPYGWQERQNSCYFLYDLKVNRLQAKLLCSSRSAFLVDYADLDEWKYLSSLLHMSSFEDQGAWTSLKFKDKKWFFAAPFQNSYNQTQSVDNWYNSTEPSPKDVEDKHTDLAIIIHKGNKIGLVAVSETTKSHAFCKRVVNARDFCDERGGWMKTDTTCLKVYKHQTQDEASTTCDSVGARLYLPQMDEQMQNLSKVLNVNQTIWVDARRDYAVKGKSTFKTRKNTPVTYLPWLSNWQVDKGKACVAVSRTSSSTGFLTLDCNEERDFICFTGVGLCPSGWVDGPDESCYGFHMRMEDKVSWPEAYNICQAYNARLVLPSTLAKGLIYGVLQDNDIHNAWLGFNGTEDYRFDVKGTYVVGSIVQYDTTQGTEGKFYCGATDYDPARIDVFAQYCYARKNFICSLNYYDEPKKLIEDTTVCSDGWQRFGGNCIQIITSASPYDDAVTTCKNMGASIFAPGDSWKQTLFSNSMFDRFALKTLWIGIRYKQNAVLRSRKVAVKNGAYVPANSNMANFYNFDVNQKYNGTSGPCVYVKSGKLASFQGAWYKEQCSALHGVVCQKTGKPGKPQDKTNVIWNPLCGPGWNYNNATRMCYWVSLFEPRTWEQARLDCLDRSANLLSISNPEEQTFMESLLGGSEFRAASKPMWIGAGDKGGTYGWAWSDNAPFAYLHWGQAEPVYRSDDGNNCGVIPISKAYRWEVRPCGDTNLYICKKTALSRKTDTPPLPEPPRTCSDPLISGDYSIQNPQLFSASSYFDDQHMPGNSRLVPSNAACWRPAKDEIGAWLGVRFLSPVTISKLEIRGDDTASKYLNKFKIQYQFDDQSLWYWMTSQQQTVRVFDTQAKSGETSVIDIGVIEAQSVRVYPVVWTNGICIKWEISGCPRDTCSPEYAMSGPLIVVDSRITASSSTPGNQPFNARLHPIHENGKVQPWMNTQDDTNPWIQVDLGILRTLRGITIKKGPNRDAYLRSFHLMFGTDKDSLMSYNQPYGSIYTFEGLNGDTDSKTIYLKSSVQVKVVRLVALDFKGSTNIFLDLLTCSIDMMSEAQLSRIPNTRLSSSHFSQSGDRTFSPDNSRISPPSGSYWKPGQSWRPNAYIEVDFEVPVQVTGVATQGSFNGAYIKSYNLEFSYDGKTYKKYITASVAKGFDGNYDDSGVVKNELHKPVLARFVRLIPLTFNKEMAVRWEVYASPRLSSESLIGCYADDPNDPDLSYSLDQTTISGGIWSQPCIFHCYAKGYLYAGLQNGGKCSCGNDYGRFGIAKDCNTTCQDPYFNFTCGGYQKNNIYSTGVGPISEVCPPQWSSYRESCYRVVTETLTWLQANDNCHTLGGQLVDINSQHENDYVASLLNATAGIDTYWIGFNDINSSLHFEWSSKSTEVRYTNWHYHQPFVNPGLEQHSVVLNRLTETWTNIFSESLHGFICKASKKPSNLPRRDINHKGCLTGWHGYGEKCFSFQHHEETRTDADVWCKSHKGGAQSGLANIGHISDYGTFLSSQLALMSGRYWIAVSDQRNNGLYVDEDGTWLTYTNWGRYAPNNDGNCVYLEAGPHAGRWRNERCTSKQNFICEMKRLASDSTTLYPPLMTSTPRPSTFCPDNWIQIAPYCYKHNSPSPKQRLTWHEARKTCTDIGADLASFHSADDFNELHVKIKSTLVTNYWIGLNDFNHNIGYEWSDKTVFNFVRWRKDQPSQNDVNDECGEYDKETGKMALQNCNLLRDWMCMIRTGKSLKPVKTFTYPNSTNQCEQTKWQRYKDYCYFFADASGGTDMAKTWRESSRWCQDKGGYLASINSEEENYFIQYNMLNSSYENFGKVWIGLNDLSHYYGYRWSDGSTLGKWILNWNVNEPNGRSGFEDCVSFVPRNGKWEDAHCAIRRGFVCKKPAKNNPSPLTPVQPVLTGNCPKGFQRFGSKCFNVMGGEMGQPRLSWNHARKACQNLIPNAKIDLASITSVLENAFVTTLLRDSGTSAWLGLRRSNYNNSSGQYMWSDNTELKFAAWNRNEPNMATNEDACVYMYKPVTLAGRWNDVACDQEASYVCQTSIDAKFPLEPAIPSPKCQKFKGFSVHGNSCLLQVKARMTWPDALEYCTDRGATLSSIMNAYDLADMVVMSGMDNDSIWIGLNDLDMPGHYKWVSGYPVTFTRWDVRQPIDDPRSSCISLTTDGLMNKENCSQKHHFVCQIDVVKPQVTPKSTSGHCSDDSFFIGTSSSSCYKITTSLYSYSAAQQQCKSMGSNIASVSDDGVHFPVPQGIKIWIGLRSYPDEGFAWEDASPLANTNWGPGQPDWTGDDAIEKGCVAIDSTQKWFNMDCDTSLGYICMTPKVDDSATATPSMQTPGIPSAPSTKSQKIPTLPTLTSVTHKSTAKITDVTHKSNTKITDVTHKSNTKITDVTQKFQSVTTAPMASVTARPASLATVISDASTTQKGNNLPDKSPNSSNGLSTGEIAGLVIGLLMLVALVFLGIVFFKYRKQLSKSFLRREAKRTKNFENSLYVETDMDVRGRTTTSASDLADDGIAQVTISTHSDIDAHNMSVRYSSASVSHGYFQMDDAEENQ